MEKVDLKEIIKQYPIAERDSSLLKALLADFNPQNKLDNNLIWLAHTVGVHDNLKNKDYVNEQDMFNLTALLEKTYGMEYSYAYHAVETWANLYGIQCSPMVVATGENGNMGSMQYDENHYPGINEIVWENEVLQLTYKSIEDLDMSKEVSTTSRFYLNYIFKNKSNRVIYTQLYDVSMNGIVFNECTAYEAIRPGKARSIRTILDLYQVQRIGFSKNEELDELSFEMAYAFTDGYFSYDKKVDSKVITIKIKK